MDQAITEAKALADEIHHLAPAVPVLPPSANQATALRRLVGIFTAQVATPRTAARRQFQGWNPLQLLGWTPCH